MGENRVLNKRLLASVWVIFICKGVLYTVLFPIWEGYDEFAHFAFIQHVAVHHELTVPDTRVSREIDRSLELAPLPTLLADIVPSSTDHDAYWKLPPQERSAREADLLKIPVSAQSESGKTFLYEGKQGPLYYWLMAPVHSLLRSTTIPDRVVVFRVINILIASLIIPVGFLTARKAFSDERIALAVCFLMAAMPELYIDASRVGNQALAMVLFAVFTMLCLRTAPNDLNHLLAAGIVLGLLLVTRAYSLALIPILGLVAVQSVKNAPPVGRPRAFLISALALVSATMVSAWWYLRNFKLAGAILWEGSAPEHQMGLGEILR